MKLAFFVEGYTETVLLKKIFLFIYGIDNLSFALFKLRGGNKIPIRVELNERYEPANNNPKYTFHVYDCGGFNSIKSMISHQRSSLWKNSFSKIIGIRDVHPSERAEIPKLRRDLPFRVPQIPIPTVFILCVMETEAWFIADYQHFLKISNLLTIEFIKSKTGLNLENIDFESIDCPSQKLNEIYGHAGESYQKELFGCIDRTLDTLDLFNLCCVLPEKIPNLREFISQIEGA